MSSSFNPFYYSVITLTPPFLPLQLPHSNIPDFSIYKIYSCQCVYFQMQSSKQSQMYSTNPSFVLFKIFLYSDIEYFEQKIGFIQNCFRKCIENKHPTRRDLKLSEERELKMNKT